MKSLLLWYELNQIKNNNNSLFVLDFLTKNKAEIDYTLRLWWLKDLWSFTTFEIGEKISRGENAGESSIYALKVI